MGNNLIPRVLFGLFFILFGLGIFIENIGINPFGFNIFSLWPIILVIIGFILLSRRQIFGGILILVLGFSFLLSNIFDLSIFSIIWPLIIVAIGISMIFKISGNRKNNFSQNGSRFVSNDYINEEVFFGESNVASNSQNFTGGKIDGVFSSFKIDLRDAKISEKGARLEINSVFSGGEVILPDNVRIEVESESFFGGVTNKSSSISGDGPILRVKASAVFAGIDIKN